MSLINDALKRATQQKRRPHAEGEPLQPVLEGGRSRSGAGMLVVVVCLALAAGAAFGIWVLWKQPAGTIRGKIRGTNATAAASKPAPGTNPVARAKGVFEKVQAGNQEGAAEAERMVGKGAAEPAKPAGGSGVVPNLTVVPAPAAANGFKVQAIYFRLDKPSAVINGKTVFAGDEVDGAKVVEIKRQSVRIQVGSEAKDLQLR